LKVRILTLIFLLLFLGTNSACALSWNEIARFPEYWGTAPNVLRETRTGNFTCSESQWRIVWNYTPLSIVNPEYVYFNIFIYRANDTVYYIMEMNQQGNTTISGTWYVTNQTGEFFLKFLVYNVLSATAVIEVPALNITLVSPQNQSYNSTLIPLTFTLNGTPSCGGYSLDGEANVTIAGNTTLTISEGSHSIMVYANDTDGYVGASDIVPFLVDVTAPQIIAVFRYPSGNVQPNQPVIVSANVSDSLSGVDSVRLVYFTNQSSVGVGLLMVLNQTSGLYERMILVTEADTLVKYQITAYDMAGNNVTDDNAGEYYVYAVIPEFASYFVVSLFMIALFLTALIYKRKCMSETSRVTKSDHLSRQ
jgi:hypothetical protein